MNGRKTTADQTTGPGSGLRHAGLCLLAALAIASQAEHANAADPERFEIVKVRAVRPALAQTVVALEKGDVAGARAAFAVYDSLWNGIEVYIGARSKAAEETLDEMYQPGIEKALSAPNPNTAAVLADAKAMLAKYDETIDMVVKAPPLNPLYDDVARLRIVRAHLREVVLALQAGNVEKARESFAAFRGAWDNVKDLVRAHSADDDAAIEKGMIEIEKLLEKPDVAGVTALVKDVLVKYNATHAALLKEARSN
jgi:hypothetical protein